MITRGNPEQLRPQGDRRGRIGILICNAPYVPTDEIAFMPPEA